MSGSLNHSPGKVLQHYLVDEGLVAIPTSLSTTWSVFLGHKPPKPDKCVTLFNREGTHDGRSMIDGYVYEHHGVQIITRADTHNNAWTKARAIVLSLDSINRTLVPIGSDTYRIQSITRTTESLDLGREPETGCFLSSLNVIVALSLLPGTGSY